MRYVDRLRAGADRTGSLLCLGLDPDPARIPQGSDPEGFLNQLLARLDEAGCLPSILKPNLAYYEQFGSRGLAVLERLLERWAPRCLILLDAKRGDIGPSSAAYARALFRTWGADAVTVSPWMGRDSLEPFLDYCPDRGVYCLLRTSNPGAADLQLHQGSWRHLAGLLTGPWYRSGLGAVMGATGPAELAEFARSLGDCEFPLLIPGVGSQGGDAAAVMQALSGTDERLARVNVSSAILYAADPVEAARAYAGSVALPQSGQKR
ncbi:MAG: orotidine-5'-phosphate decarboxylase [Candidatus Eremiobacterota bacterium]